MADSANVRAVHAGQAVYTRPMLAVYDYVVLGAFCRFVWRCPKCHILKLYQGCVSANHLDAGVGTGYFLDHCRLPSPQPRLALLDLNQYSLQVAAKRLARYRPETYRADVLQPLNIRGPGFDSVGISALLHCLPGTMRAKAVALDHLKAVLNPGGVLFGATLLGKDVPATWLARLAMKRFNAVRVFCNRDDSLSGLHEALTARLVDVSLRLIGCVALFSGRNPALPPTGPERSRCQT
jgi:SAM-dependent methyltransferase